MKTVYMLVAALFFAASAMGAQSAAIKLATTTSTENSGLLASLLPLFTKETGISVHVIAVGSGKAIKLGESGDVDVVLVHSRKAEEAFVRDSFGINRRDVMYNDFILVGPLRDSLEISGTSGAAAAMKKISLAKAPFISRGDESGTHAKEKEIWTSAGLTPSGTWYLSAGQGMEAVLLMAHEKQGYTLSDRGTYIAISHKLELSILCEGDTTLFNPYGIIAVNPARHPGIKYKEAMRFINWITSSAGQKCIAGFTKNGKSIFFPNAMLKGKKQP